MALQPLITAEITKSGIFDSFGCNTLQPSPYMCVSLDVINDLDTPISISFDRGLSTAYDVQAGETLSLSNLSINDVRIRYTGSTAPASGSVQIIPYSE